MKLRKRIAAFGAAMVMAVSMMSIGASAYITNYPNQFTLIHTDGAPTSQNQTSLTNYASMGQYDPALTIRVTYCTTSSNTRSCRFTAPLRASTEPYWTPFSYAGQQKDIALKSHGTIVYFTCELVRENNNYGYGTCNFYGTAN